MIAFVDRASVAPARPMNPSLVRELGFFISRASGHIRCKYYAHEREISALKVSNVTAS